MPKISDDADSVAQHVAQQEAHVFDTALRLFAERGYAHVTLADIAAEVGLKRNSLYRYFPSKAHILVQWFRTELPAQTARSAALLQGPGTPVQRILHWVDDQLDYAAKPEHALIAALADVVPDLDGATRAELAGSHDQLLLPLRSALAEAGIRGAAQLDAAADLVTGMVLVAAQREARVGRDKAVRAQLAKAIEALIPHPQL